MGLDGVSINQLRITPENNSAELNSQVRFQDNNFGKIDGLSEGQRVDSKKRERQNQNNNSLSQKKGDIDEEENEEDSFGGQYEVNETNPEEIIKYDLTNSKLYSLKLEEATNKIMIIEKATGNVIQVFDADDLRRFVNFMPDSCGALVNKKL